MKMRTTPSCTACPPRWRFLLLPALVLSSACEVREQIEERYRDVTSHEIYAASLRAAGLEASAAHTDWMRAAGDAVTAPLTVGLPHREQGYLDPTSPQAMGYRFSLERGQRLRVDLTRQEVQEGRWFVDLFRVPNDPTRTPYHELGSRAGESSLEYDAPRSGEFILRVQPELLRGGSFSLDVRVMPTLAFPVEGRDPSAILSRWGADRDGGRRQHRGVDIFAPRGTPVLAAAAGRITRVDTTEIGGLVVWLREDRNRHNLYYAHLNRQLVREGQRVQPGDTVGLVGNTGNARTTPPHLHFGIYRRGAVDPFPFIEPQDTVLRAVPESSARLVGAWARASVDNVVVRDQPRSRATEIARVQRGAALQVLGATPRYLRVRLPEGLEGYASLAGLQEVREPLLVLRPAEGTPLLVAPAGDAPVRARVGPDAQLEVVALHDRYGMVVSEDGKPGWLPLSTTQAEQQ